MDIGNYILAMHQAEEALAVIEGSTREIPPWTRVVVLHNLATALRGLGHAERSEDLLETTLALLRGLGSPAGWTATVLLELSHLRRQVGDLSHAAELAGQSVRLARDIGDRRGTAAALEGLAAAFASAGATVGATRLVIAAKMIRSELGAPIPPSEALGVDQILAAARDSLGDSSFRNAASSGAVMSLDDVIAGSLVLATEVTSRASSVIAGRANAGAAASRYGLTARELEVLALLVEGISNPEIATTLFISQKTVRNHLTNIFGKLGVESRTAAATLALRQGLV
jgi:DNA-binding CsgD family transcriptional regulator